MFIETEKIELKKVLNDSFLKGVVAFLNTFDGKIIIGVNDDGTIHGINNYDFILRKIGDLISDDIQPSALDFIKADVEIIDDKKIINVDVKKGSSSIYYIKKFGLSANGCFVRVGTSCRSLTESEIKNRYEQSLNIPIKTIVSEESYHQNLSFNILKTYYISKQFHVNENTFFCNYALLTKEGKFNLLANLLADENDISIKVVTFAGNDKSELIEKTEYGYVSIIAAINRVLDRLEAINVTKSVIGASRRIDKKLLDKKCLREAFINAIAHNDWVDGTPPALYVFSDRIEIISTGGLPKYLDLEDFYLGISKPRNKELMRILKDLEFVEQSGYGVPRIIKIYGKEAFHFSNFFIRVLLFYDKDVMTSFSSYRKNDGVSDGVSDGVNDGVNIFLSGNAKLVYKIIRDKKANTTNEIILIFDKSKPTVERALRELKENKLIKRIGSDKSGYWDLPTYHKNDGVSDDANDVVNDGVNIFLSGNAKLVYKIIRDKKANTTNEIIRVIDKSKPTVERALRELKENKLIKRIGSDKSGYWDLPK
ncbi:MAG: putative DNA binding domain-containing protein [Erysipelotrichales bacterium]|nr:putative DNA binding domain-containing protein [Erysipelotrichales bacterium]